ncbi:hypothetical protein BDW59DRAFT_137324 [Aspergillus cavernicola]|uniref:Uncharacterized protein n=1 Tax=Aspergillus cavernicola TaxID=176166 RepID=A0ABR4J581_9EURO
MYDSMKKRKISTRMIEDRTKSRCNCIITVGIAIAIAISRHQLRGFLKTESRGLLVPMRNLMLCLAGDHYCL